MAISLSQITRTVTTDFTDQTTKNAAQAGIAANLAALEVVTEQDLKAAQVLCLAYFLKTGITIAAGTDYTNNLGAAVEQALALFNEPIPRLDRRMKNMLDATLTANSAIYATATTPLLIDSGLAAVRLIRNYSAEELDKTIAFLRLKAGV